MILTGLAVNLEVASHLASGPALEAVQRSRGMAKDLLSDVRAVVGRMREEPRDVLATLADMADAVSRPVVHLQVTGLADHLLDCREVDCRETEALLRCVQEVITNAMRHADADNLWITIESAGSQTLLRARDDGAGAAAVTPGNGLTGMRERLTSLGGELIWDGGAGNGFRVEARMPSST